MSPPELERGGMSPPGLGQGGMSPPDLGQGGMSPPDLALEWKIPPDLGPADLVLDLPHGEHEHLVVIQPALDRQNQAVPHPRLVHQGRMNALLVSYIQLR